MRLALLILILSRYTILLKVLSDVHAWPVLRLNGAILEDLVGDFILDDPFGLRATILTLISFFLRCSVFAEFLVGYLVALIALVMAFLEQRL